MIPELYTPAEVAQRLKLYRKGEPNTVFIHKLVASGMLACVRISKNNIRFTEEQIAAYVEQRTWQKETGDRASPLEKTERGGESSNTGTVRDIGLLAASQASVKLRNSLRSGKDKSRVLSIPVRER